MNTLKTIIISTFFLLPLCAHAQGGDDPVEGIDIIIKEDPSQAPVAGFALNATSLKEVSALKDEARSHYLAKSIPAQLDKVTRQKFDQKEWQAIFLKHLLANRCNPCKSFETFSFKAKASRTKQAYDIQIILHTKVSSKKPMSDVKASAKALYELERMKHIKR